METYTPDGSRVIHRTSVDLSKRHISDPIHVVQYDNKLPIIEVHIYNDGDLYNIPDNAVINIRFGKPDYTFVYNPAIGISSDKTKVYFEVTAAMTEIAGEYTPIIEIQSGSNVGGTSSIPVNVDKNPITNGMIESTTEFKLLVEYVAEAKGYAEGAKTSETNAKTSETNAKSSETKAAASATAAKSSETNSKASETAANISAVNAKDSETKSKASETAAKTSETNAKTSETNAKSSETNAKTSETNAKTSETNAKKYLDDATKLWNDETTALNAAEETRKQNEIGRQTNETKRETQYNKMVTATTESVEATNNAVAIKELVETKLANGEFKGDTGPKGEKGDTGPKGEKGEPGNASESINDDTIDKLHSWSSDKTNAEIKGQVGVMTGPTINIANSYNGGLLLKELQGKSVQNGTPTPDAKVDIVSVGDDGSVVVKITGKNLLPRGTVGGHTNAGITTIVNQDGTYTSNGTVSDNINNWILGRYNALPSSLNTIVTLYPKKTYVIKDVSLFTIENGNIQQLNPGIVTINEKEFPNGFRVTGVRHVAVAVGTVLSNKVYYPQLEQGSTSTTYEPYKEQLVTIPLTQPLRSVGSVYDRGCVKKDGLWGVDRKFASVVFNGSTESWQLSTTYTDDTYLCAYVYTPTVKFDCNVLCNKFINGRYIAGKTSEMIGSISNNINLCILKSRLSTPDINGLKAWLSANPITVVYELATPTFEPLSQSLQDQLNALQTYQGVTNVFTTDTLQPNMIVEYGKTDTSALSLYANNIQDSKANKVDIPTKLPANGGNADTLGGVSINDICKVSKSILGDIDWNEAEISFNTWYAFTPETTNTPSGYGYIQRIKLSATDWYFDVAYNTDGNRSIRENINGQGWTKWRIIETDNPIINLKKYGAVGDGVVDDTKAFKDALVVLEAVGGTLLVPRGVYLIQDVLYIPQNSKIVGDGEVFLKRNADINALMLTKTDPLIGGYDGFKNVVIENIGFDGASGNFIPTCTLFASYHARNVIIKNCKFQNLDAWHMVEFNSTSDSKIIDCEFYNYGYSGSGGASEMVQLDFAYESGYPWQGLWDNTPCSNITIKNNVFRNSTMDAIGNHSYLEGATSKNITIENNVFDNIQGVCVDLNDIDTLIVINNNFKLSPVAIRINAQKNVNENIIINSNYYKYKVTDPYVGIEARFVMINQTGALPYDTRNITISDNIVDGANTHAIGITANNVIISNNKISGAYKNGIYVYGGENYVISNNILTGSGLTGWADLTIGNNGVITAIKVIVFGNIINKLIIGANYDNVFIHGNTITSITQGDAISKNNIINGSYVS